MSSFFTLLFLVCCIFMDLVTASKPLSILVIQSLASPSHHVWTVHLIKGLLRKGHHVHAISIEETKIEDKLAQNLTYAVFDDLMKTFEEFEDHNPAQWEAYSALYMTYFMPLWAINSCNIMIKTKEAKDLLEMIKTVEFDVIVHGITLDYCFYGLWEVAKGKPPIVGYVLLGSAPWLKDYIGGPNYPTIRPYPAALTKPVSLWERTWNVLYYISNDVIRYYYYLPTCQQLVEKFMGHAIRPLHEIEKDRINILLLNTHPAFESGIPLPPNTLQVAGLTAQTVEPIAGEVVVTYSEDMRIFLDEAKNGVIVISLGTNVKWKSIGLDKVKAVLLALSKLKQRVLWKLDVEVPFQIPTNLMIVKWMPQNEVLCTSFDS